MAVKKPAVPSQKKRAAPEKDTPKQAALKKGSAKSTPQIASETQGLTKLGGKTEYRFDTPSLGLLEAFPNRYPGRDYVIRFEHPEFTSLCPMTGQPDFGSIIVEYAPGEQCVESKSFKLYMTSFRNEGSFMESLTNKIADDLVMLLSPRRMTVRGMFNVRGGTSISVRVEHLDPSLSEEEKKNLLRLW